jgi:hypothetical protein
MPPLQPVDAFFTAGRCLFFVHHSKRPSGGTPQGPHQAGHPRDTPGTPGENAGASPMPPLQPVDASFTAGRCLFLCIIRRGPSGGTPQGPHQAGHPRDTPGTPGKNAGAQRCLIYSCLLYSRAMPSLQPGDVFFFVHHSKRPLRRDTPGTSPQGHPRDTPGTPGENAGASPMPSLQPGDASFTAGRCLLYSRAMSFFVHHSKRPLRRGTPGTSPQGHHPREALRDPRRKRRRLTDASFTAGRCLFFSFTL